FVCPGPGVFQCSVTDLVFAMTQEADLQYRSIQWDRNLLHPAGRIPAGPLYHVRCSKKAVCRIHLPHCETQSVSSIKGLLSVVHISNDDEDGMSILQPMKITASHVIVEVSGLSAFGLVWDYLKRFMERKDPVLSQILLYLGPMTSRAQNQKLYVFLLPRNIPKEEVHKDQRDCRFVRCTSYCKLIKDQKYILVCPRASQDYKIQPKKAEFNLNFGDQYHPMFEIRLPINTEEVAITINDEGSLAVWEYEVDLTDYSQSNQAASGSGVQPEITNQKENMLEILEELRKEQFESFKWFLAELPQKRFKQKELEAASRLNVVDLIMQQCGSEEDAVKVMRTLLRKIKRNDLMKGLKR
ncbi:PREDICTED: NACHT, LRR and PYD domains-containing protein 1a-like, partial [Cyprinodon variegatus]|uniref:NACHT, LRR and PYD domains-containing protein 1a-like n=1 Tax=Cyprinodon variegatus TaxID=28743 RepID=UPI00074253A5